MKDMSQFSQVVVVADLIMDVNPTFLYSTGLVCVCWSYLDFNMFHTHYANKSPIKGVAII